MNILITGAIGVGKSTLIKKLIADTKAPMYGFFTEKMKADESGNAKVYIRGIRDAAIHREEDVVGICADNGAKGRAEVFDRRGVQLISNIPNDAIIIMDELGFLESAATQFCNTVIRRLNEPRLVIAAVKQTNTAFLEKVRMQPNSNVYTMTVDNRDDLYEQITTDLMNLNR